MYVVAFINLTPIGNTRYIRYFFLKMFRLTNFDLLPFILILLKNKLSYSFCLSLDFSQ
jgi:hypothetical protein